MCDLSQLGQFVIAGLGGHDLPCPWSYLGPHQKFPIDFKIIHWKCALQNESVLAL